jgi:hypothetical protein
MPLEPSAGGAVFLQPAVDALLRPEEAASGWPAAILNSAARTVQAERRLHLFACMSRVFERIADPTVDLGDGLAAGLVTAGDAAQLFAALGRLLEEEPVAGRLVLYWPFELLPDRRRPAASPELYLAQERLATVFLRRWHDLLAVSDVRASFVDGDILEPELGAGPPPRVVKAAHLLPPLVGKGLLSPAELGPLVERAFGEETLLDSLSDAIAVLEDLNLLPGNHLSRVRRMLPARERPDAVQEPPPGPVSQARLDWQRRRRQGAALDLRAEAIAAAVLGAPAPAGRLAAVLSEPPTDDPAVVRIHAAGKILESLAAADRALAAATHRACDPLLQALWRSGTAEVRDALIGRWSRLAALGVIDESHWQRLGLDRPRLDATRFGDPDLHRVVQRRLAGLIDPPASLSDLRRLIYPAVLFFGSRLKGYAAHDADLDAAVFVKPGVPAADRPQALELLSRAGGGKIVDLWLREESDCRLTIQDLAQPEDTQAGSEWVHVLFGGAWYGDRQTIEMLHARLLTPCLRSRRLLADGRTARELWLEELERDNLQYRLMHSGYARFFPPQGGIRTAHAARIDSASAFWDSGFRRLASLLYLKRVFLPLLEGDGT